jgi:S-adenosylmethionine:tRNA ribosyltransferase-isomerase
MSASLLTDGAVGSGNVWRTPRTPPDSLDFKLPSELAAAEPPEARGLTRDGVRLMVSCPDDDSIVHARFHDLPDFLAPGDLLVANVSATINAALNVWRMADDRRLERVVLHLSSPLGDGRWVVELRMPTPEGTVPLLGACRGEKLRLPAGGSATLAEPLRIGPDQARDGRVRLWLAEIAFPGAPLEYLDAFGSPIRYGYVRDPWPLAYYQTMFATERGSAEMPSAGRGFTPQLVTRLYARGVRIAPLVLHTGVSSLESDEPPYPERYRVPVTTADVINATRSQGGRIIAVGTTVVRALETVATEDGRVRPGGGWTDLVVTSDRGLRAVDGLVTGFHAPRATHLAMLEALAGRHHVALAYEAALRQRYLWHEFGELHLMVKRSPSARRNRR